MLWGALSSLTPKTGGFLHPKNDNSFLNQLSILFSKMASIPLGTPPAPLPWLLLFYSQSCYNLEYPHRPFGCPTWDLFFWVSQSPASVSTAPCDSIIQTSIISPGTANIHPTSLGKRTFFSHSWEFPVHISVINRNLIQSHKDLTVFHLQTYVTLNAFIHINC